MWLYRLHGDGCELLHVETKERYDWDVRDPQIFFTGQFDLYLKWMIHSRQNDPDLDIYTSWNECNLLDLPVLLGYLVEKNILATRFPHEWKLLSSSNTSQ